MVRETVTCLEGRTEAGREIAVAVRSLIPPPLRSVEDERSWN